MTKPVWLPEALSYGDFNGEWEEFLAVAYSIFERDFKRSKPQYDGRQVVHDARIENGKEAGFWHIVQRDDSSAGKRIPDLRRCERVAWPKPIVEHSTDRAISLWQNERGGQTRILIWIEDMDYIVVLADRLKVMVLVTAFCTDIESYRRKLRKERDDYRRKQKPPRGAT